MKFCRPVVVAAATAMILPAAARPTEARALGVGCKVDSACAFIPLVRVQEMEVAGIFRGVGVVTAIDSRAGAVTLKHEEIKGFMAAMIMMYRVKPFSLAAGLLPGDKVEFAIDAQTYTIQDLKLIERKP